MSSSKKNKAAGEPFTGGFKFSSLLRGVANYLHGKSELADCRIAQFPIFITVIAEYRPEPSRHCHSPVSTDSTLPRTARSVHGQLHGSCR